MGGLRNDVPHDGTSPGARAVERALDVLWAFVEGPSQMGISQLSRKLGLSKATTHRLVGALVRRQLLSQDPRTALYSLGVAALRLGNAFLKSLDVREAALPVMQDLAQRTGETVNLNIVRDGCRVCIEKVDSVQAVRHFVELGRPEPLYAGASGKVLLAFMDPAEVETVIRRGLRRLTPRTVTDPDRLRAELAEIRRRGYAVSAGERVDGASAVSAPVRNAQGQVVAGLTVSGPTYRFTHARVRAFITLVLQGAAAVSEALGHVAGSEPSAGEAAGRRGRRRVGA